MQASLALDPFNVRFPLTSLLFLLFLPQSSHGVRLAVAFSSSRLPSRITIHYEHKKINSDSIPFHKSTY